jgi:hypothetical protein
MKLSRNGPKGHQFSAQNDLKVAQVRLKFEKSQNPPSHCENVAVVVDL